MFTIAHPELHSNHCKHMTTKLNGQCDARQNACHSISRSSLLEFSAHNSASYALRVHVVASVRRVTIARKTHTRICIISLEHKLHDATLNVWTLIGYKFSQRRTDLPFFSISRFFIIFKVNANEGSRSYSHRFRQMKKQLKERANRNKAGRNVPINAVPKLPSAQPSTVLPDVHVGYRRQ